MEESFLDYIHYLHGKEVKKMVNNSMAGELRKSYTSDEKRREECPFVQGKNCIHRTMGYREPNVCIACLLGEIATSLNNQEVR